MCIHPERRHNAGKDICEVAASSRETCLCENPTKDDAEFVHHNHCMVAWNGCR